jgi:hypothetical protein
LFKKIYCFILFFKLLGKFFEENTSEKY